MEFDAARVAVLPGEPGDVVGRFPGVVVVARCAEPDLLRALLTRCADAAGPEPGRALARSLARWLASEDDLPDRIVFGTVSTVGEQLAVFLSGAAMVEIGDTVLSGTDAAAWTDRLLPVTGPVRLALHGAVGRIGSLPDVLDLRGGVVPGSGAIIHGGGPSASRPAAASASRPVPAEPRRVQPLPERSPLAPDPGPHPRGNGVVPAVELRSPESGERAVARTGSVQAPPERPDERGAGEDFSGEWFAGPGPKETGGGDAQPAARSPRVAPQDPARAPARHAVYGRSDGEPAAADVGLADPPTPRSGTEQLTSEKVIPEKTADGEITEAAPLPAEPAEREPSGTVPAPRKAPTEAPTEAAPSSSAPSSSAPSSSAPSSSAPSSSVPSPAPPAAPARNGHPASQNGAAPPPADAEHQVPGLLCARGHLNDPRSQFCTQCGGRIDERGSVVVGPRPPLGVLVFDDGATYTVDADFLVGRMPESDQRVTSGELRPIVVEDRSGAVSRVHAEIHIDGWDVLLSDTGSRNGTFVAGPSQQGWSPLPPGRSRRLVPGTRVRMGGRTFVFEAPDGASSA
ncbi:FHA domain-containing protein [Pseudonocardia thermophila]|uniref:FHA domain-containing protein n=1 Tax=Pseudonocardia thermophila TaxID=1848 RepID=UPI00248D7261|nr:FHA domain-containing protein [Pseudonocardia thermophila]